ncbi:MAG TPA: thioredoxin family protein [Gaiellaceae bacterium]|nr:thioredoxin family protein [Gaiellaceae bacterium]
MPKLLVFESKRSGECRQLRARLAQVLQRRSNHDTFQIVPVDVDARPDLAERFRIHAIPTLIVVDEHVVRGRLPGGATAKQIADFLQPWLRPSGRQARRAVAGVATCD